MLDSATTLDAWYAELSTAPARAHAVVRAQAPAQLVRAGLPAAALQTAAARPAAVHMAAVNVAAVNLMAQS